MSRWTQVSSGVGFEQRKGGAKRKNKALSRCRLASRPFVNGFLKGFSLIESNNRQNWRVTSWGIVKKDLERKKKEKKKDIAIPDGSGV